MPHPLRQRDFSLMWMGVLLSMMGTQMRVVAVTWQLYQLTHSAVSLGAIGLTRFVPLALLALPAGLAADRLDRRRVLLVTQVIMMASSAALWAWTARGEMTATRLYLLLTISSAAAAFELPARQAITPALVAREQLTQALTLNITGYNVAAVVGPSLGGLVLAQGGVTWVYAFDTISFAAMIAAVLCVRYRHFPEARDASRSALDDILEGLRFVRAQRLILSSMLIDFVAMFFGAATMLLPIFADRIVHVDAVGLGLLYAAPAAGSVTAGLVTALRSQVHQQGRALLRAVAVYGLATAAFGLSHSFLLSLVLLAITGAADTVSAVIRNTIRQTHTPDTLRGRMTAINALFFVGGPQLGEVEAGLAAHWLGVGPSVVLGGLGCVAGAVLVARWAPELRHYDH